MSVRRWGIVWISKIKFKAESYMLSLPPGFSAKPIESAYLANLMHVVNWRVLKPLVEDESVSSRRPTPTRTGYHEDRFACEVRRQWAILVM